MRSLFVGAWTVALSIILPGSHGGDAQVFLKPTEIHEGVFLTSPSVSLITDESFFRAVELSETSEIDVASVRGNFTATLPTALISCLSFQVCR